MTRRFAEAETGSVLPGALFDAFTPDVRVATAVAPFLAAMMARVYLGRSNLTRWLITAGTMWFTFNVLMAPYSAGMRQDLMDLQQMFR